MFSRTLYSLVRPEIQTGLRASLKANKKLNHEYANFKNELAKDTALFEEIKNNTGVSGKIGWKAKPKSNEKAFYINLYTKDEAGKKQKVSKDWLNPSQTTIEDIRQTLKDRLRELTGSETSSIASGRSPQQVVHIPETLTVHQPQPTNGTPITLQTGQRSTRSSSPASNKNLTVSRESTPPPESHNQTNSNGSLISSQSPEVKPSTLNAVTETRERKTVHFDTTEAPSSSSSKNLKQQTSQEGHSSSSDISDDDLPNRLALRAHAFPKSLRNNPAEQVQTNRKAHKSPISQEKGKAKENIASSTQQSVETNSSLSGILKASNTQNSRPMRKSMREQQPGQGTTITNSSATSSKNATQISSQSTTTTETVSNNRRTNKQGTHLQQKSMRNRSSEQTQQENTNNRSIAAPTTQPASHTETTDAARPISSSVQQQPTPQQQRAQRPMIKTLRQNASALERGTLRNQTPRKKPSTIERVWDTLTHSIIAKPKAAYRPVAFTMETPQRPQRQQRPMPKTLRKNASALERGTLRNQTPRKQPSKLERLWKKLTLQ